MSKAKLMRFSGVLIPKNKVTVTKQGCIQSRSKTKENRMFSRPKHRRHWWHKLFFTRRVSPYELLNEASGVKRSAQ